MRNLPTLLSLLFLICPIAYSDTIHVPADQSTIQDGITAARNGDTVLVESGAYKERIDFRGKAITVVSEDGPETTTLWESDSTQPSKGSMVSFVTGEGADSVLEGFTITGGTGTKLEASNHFYGGGICCTEGTAPIIMDCILHDNRCSDGAGIYCVESSPHLINCTIKNNFADDDGGAAKIKSGAPVFEDCRIEENFCCGLTGEGGGICNLNGDTTLIRCTVFKNEHLGRWGPGGGISNYMGKITASYCVFERNRIELAYDGGAIANTQGELDLSDCIFKHNDVASPLMSDDGGAIWSSKGVCRIARCLFYENLAGYYGGGIASFDSHLFVNDSVFCRNAGAGAAVFCGNTDARLTNCTFHDNRDYGKDRGLYCTDDSNLIISNSIFWNEPLAGASEIWIDDVDSTVTISYSNLLGGIQSVHQEPGCTLNWGNGMLSANPIFMDPALLDFHIPFNSPCRGSGDNSVAGLSDFDFENDPRIFQGTVDLGADEFAPHFYCSGDFQPSGDIFVNFVSLPGTTSVGLFIGSGLLDPPLHHPWGDFFLQAPWLVILFPPIPANGILSIPATIPGMPDPPYEVYLQALIGEKTLSNLFTLEIHCPEPEFE